MEVSCDRSDCQAKKFVKEGKPMIGLVVVCELCGRVGKMDDSDTLVMKDPDPGLLLLRQLLQAKKN